MSNSLAAGDLALVPLLMAALAGIPLSCSRPSAQPAPAPESARFAGRIPADHHVHLLGPGLIRDWKSVGVTFSRPDSTYLSAAGLLGRPEGEGVGADSEVERAVLVPMAHLYGNSEFRDALGISLEEERNRVAAENDHVAREARRWGGRAVALCSVSVLRPYAMEELRRCRRELGSTGIKVHLASSEVDLRDAEDVGAVERIFAWAEREGLPVLLHLDPQRRGLEVEDIDRFAREALEPHPRLRVVVAHLGGSGGYGAWTRSVFRALLDWLDEREAAGDPRPEVFFDLSAVVLEEESEGVPPSTPEDLEALAADLRSAGPDRLLFGSDAPVFDPLRTAQLLAERVGLTEGELERILDNVLPGLFDS